jgi:hypothetical protein
MTPDEYYSSADPDNPLNTLLSGVYSSNNPTNLLLSANSANITNNYRGDAEKILKAKDAMAIGKSTVEAGNRDVQAGIQYFTVNQGVNRRTMIEPVIGPRITDQEVWGSSEVVRDGINKQTFRDITEEDLALDEMGDRNGRRADLGAPSFTVTRVQGSRVPQNYIDEPTNMADYPGAAYYYENMDRRDFQRDILPLYKNFNSFPNIKQEMQSAQPRIDQRDRFDRSMYEDLQLQPSTESPVDLVENDFQRPSLQIPGGGNGPDFPGMARKPVREGFAMRQSDVRRFGGTGRAEGFAAISKPQSVPFGGDSTMPPRGTATPLSDVFYNEGTIIQPSAKYYDVADRVPPGQNVQVTPVTDQLMQQSPNYIFTDDYFKQPATRLYLQDVQPGLYSYAVDQTPINSNVGITYNPQRAPKILDQITDGNLAYPLYTRIDPQLVRSDGTPGQLARNPTRTNWSSEYSDWKAAPGTINFEDIYDPRFTSYGDPYRSYSDVNLGQVQYYYSDVDAYRRPNFISRTNVDFIDFTNPNGQVWPYYNRTASVDDVRTQVENQFDADAIFHREDIMESLMSKRNRETWQLRYAPLQKAAHSNMGYGPSS